MHAHAFSPMEMVYGVELTGMAIREYLLMLKANGLDTLPGTAAEILDDDVRHVLSRNKLSYGAVARGHRDRARVRHSQHLNHDVRPQRDARTLGRSAACSSATYKRAPAASPNSCRLASFTTTRCCSRKASRAGRHAGRAHESTRAGARHARRVDPSHSGLVGEAGTRSFAAGLAGGGRRLRRHALRGEHLAAGGLDRRAVHFRQRNSRSAFASWAAFPRSATRLHPVHRPLA